MERDIGVADVNGQKKKQRFIVPLQVGVEIGHLISEIHLACDFQPMKYL